VVELNDSLVSKDKGDTVSGARKRKRKRELVLKNINSQKKLIFQERMRLWRKSIKQKSILLNFFDCLRFSKIKILFFQNLKINSKF